MTVTVKVLIESKQAEDVQTTQFTSTNLRTIIDKFTVTNTTSTNTQFAVNLVAEGDVAGSDNLIVNRVIVGNSTYLCPELTGHVLDVDSFISTIAEVNNALTIRASGREVTV